MGMQVIEVYADVWCPFAHVGIRRVVERRDALGADAVLRVQPWPLELVNGRPMDAAFIGEEVVDIRDQVAPDLFARFYEHAFPASTLPAPALVDAAYEIHLPAGERASPLVPAPLSAPARPPRSPPPPPPPARDLGVAEVTDRHRQAVLDAWQQGTQRGVVGSPHFFTPNGAFFCPALDISRVDGHLRIRAKAGMFDEFLHAAFG